MEQTLSVKPRKINGGIIVIALTVAATLLRGASFMEYAIRTIVDLIEHPSSFSVAYLFAIVEALVLAFADALPLILFLAYFCFCFRRSKATVLLPISIGVLCLGQFVHYAFTLFDFVQLIYNYRYYLESDFVWAISSLLSSALENFVLGGTHFVAAIASALILIGSLKGFSNKALVIAPASVATVGYCSATAALAVRFILHTIARIVIINEQKDHYGDYSPHYHEQMIEQLERGLWVNTFWYIGSIMAALAFAALFLAIIIFAAKNYIPEIVV